MSDQQRQLIRLRFSYRLTLAALVANTVTICVLPERYWNPELQLVGQMVLVYALCRTGDSLKKLKQEMEKHDEA